MTFAEFLPLFFMAVMGLSLLAYVILDGYDLGVGMLLPWGSDSQKDTMIASIGTVLEADRTLGGLCDWAEPEAPASVDLPIEGATALKAAIVTVVLHYTTNGPLA